MSQAMPILELTTDKASDSSSFTAIVSEMIADTSRSSGSLESNTSVGSSLSAPSLETSHSTSTTASTASSTNPSPCPSILVRSDSSLTFPSRSGSSSPNISFAPLPQIDHRKRKNSRPLGVAARSHLLRQRRMLREHNADPNAAPYPYGPGSGVQGGRGYPGHYEDGPVEIREAQADVDADEEAGARASRSRSLSDPSDEARLSLGKLVKGAGKSLWKSLSMRDMRSREREAAAQVAGEAAGAEGEAEGPPGGRPRGGSLRGMESLRMAYGSTESVHLFEDEDAGPKSGDGGVWEEELVDGSWNQLLSDAQTTPEPEQIADSQHRPSAELARTNSTRTAKAEAGAPSATGRRSRTR